MTRPSFTLALSLIALFSTATIILTTFGWTFFLIVIAILLSWLGIEKGIFNSLERFDKFLTRSLNAGVLVFCFSASIFLLLHIDQHYLRTKTYTASDTALATVPVKPYALPSTIPSPMDSVDNQTLLAVLSLIVVFAGLMSYIFLQIVRSNLRKELPDMAHDERIASKIDMTISSSNQFTELYDFVKTLYNKSKYEYLEKAIAQDQKGLELFEKMTRSEKYKGLYIKIQNNYAYDTYLKCKESGCSTSEEIERARTARDVLRKYLTTPFYNKQYEGISEQNRQEIRDTCNKIDTFFH